MNGDIQKIVDELALVNNMEKLKKLAKFFNIIASFIEAFFGVYSRFVLRLLIYFFNYKIVEKSLMSKNEFTYLISIRSIETTFVGKLNPLF
jgi:hypothetical protein